MLQNLPIILSGMSFLLPIIPKIVLTAPNYDKHYQDSR